MNDYYFQPEPRDKRYWVVIPLGILCFVIADSLFMVYDVKIRLIVTILIGYFGGMLLGAGVITAHYMLRSRRKTVVK